MGSDSQRPVATNPMQAPLEGLQLIEASAGTGKTYTISGLFLRLLLEKQLPVQKILVVTFTKAATEELRDRIRKRLVDALLAFTAAVAGEAVEDNDELISQLLKSNEDPLAALDLLRVALFSFDQVPLLTIHAFSQRVLQDHAFGAAVPFDAELLEDESELRQQVVDDYWRKQVIDLPAPVLKMLLAKGGAAALSNGLHSWVDKPVLTLPIQPLPDNDPEPAWLAAVQHFSSVWQASDDAREYLLNSPDLNRSKVRKNTVAKLFAGFDQLVQSGECPADAYKTGREFLLAGDKAKKGKQVKEFSLYSAVDVLVAAYGEVQRWLDGWHQALQVDLLQTLRRELPLLKSQQRLRGYGDFLSDLNAALDGDSAGQLIDNVREKISAALIDEFQDTDELQFDNFHRLFVGGYPSSTAMPVFMVGDPKQAIYSFRGADIYAYLNAREKAEQRYSLATNWRSSPALIAAVNTLFLRRAEPFVLSEIQYFPVAAAEKPREQLNLPPNLGEAAMTLLRLPDSDGKTARTPASAIQESLNHCANTIASILQAALKNEAFFTSDTGDKRPVSGGDIAVIVRSNKQGSDLQQQLRLRGVNAIRTDQASVWNSDEADSVLRLLLAMLDPRPPIVRAALATPLFGFTVTQLTALNADELEWETWLLTLKRWRALWQTRGLSRCWQQLNDEQSVPARLLQQTGGARMLTNANHVVELLAAEALKQGWDSVALLQWCQHCMADPTAGDSALLRLDSDENLVRIVTVHKSKGLEYPLVFCPTMFAQLSEPKGLIGWHSDDGTAQLNFAELAEEAALARWQREQLAEDMRLLYVALTRAAHRCWLYCGAFSASAERNALTWLLHGNEEPVGDMSSLLADADPSDMAVVDIELDEPVCELVMVGSSDAHELIAAKANRQIYQSWRVTSFTGVGKALQSDGELDSYVADAADRDQPIRKVVVEESEPAGVHAFPRGARAGSCLHWMLEEMDFANVTDEHVASLAKQGLERYGYSEEWQAIAEQMLHQTVATPLVESDCLAGLRPGQWLPEMEFHFPLNGLSGDALLSLLREHNFGEGTAIADRLQGRSFPPIDGFMKGFIDLIFEANGRYYLADYKSNWLGSDSSAYGAETMNEAIAEADYYLQYLIYSVALHRHLQRSITAYCYDEHFGGCLYLFLRGMTGLAQSGVYFDRPSEALLSGLSSLLAGDSA